MSPRDHLPRLDRAQLAALIVETLLNGVFWVLLIQSIQAMRYRAISRRETFWKPMSFTAMFLFCTITGHWLLDIVLAFDAFILQSGSFCIQEGALLPAEKVYLTLSEPKSVATSATYVASTVVGDAFMIYRLYIVWGRNKWVTIPPLIFCITLAGTGSMVTYLFSQSRQPIFATAGSWITSCFVLTFVCNLYSTGLIALRIFLSNRTMARSNMNAYGMTKILEILVESAALYSFCVIISLSTYVSLSNVQFVAVAATNPIIGIIFCMIVTRAHTVSTSVQDSSIPSTVNRTARYASNHPLRPMAVKITTQVEGEVDSDPKNAADFGSPPSSPRIYPMQLHSHSQVSTAV